jgi:hypothetical protein
LASDRIGNMRGHATMACETPGRFENEPNDGRDHPDNPSHPVRGERRSRRFEQMMAEAPNRPLVALEQSPEPAHITVARRDERDVRDRQVIVSVDGQRIATLLFGDEATRAVAPGRHRLRVHNTLFWRTFDLELKPGEHARFSVSNRALAVITSLFGLLGAAPLALAVEREAD